MKSQYSIILLFVAASLLGFLTIQKIPFRFHEKNVTTTISIHYNWPNATPELLEKEVTTPLEGILQTINGIKKVSSVSDYHRGTITLEIDNPDEANKIRIETASQIRYLFKKLPSGVSYPVISQNNATDNNIRPLFHLQVIGDKLDDSLVNYIQQKIIPKLTSIKGVHKVEFQGIPQKNWHISYQSQLLTTLGITEFDLLNALHEVSSQENIGTVINTLGKRHAIRTVSHLTTKEDLNNLEIRAKNGNIFPLSSIATVKKVQSENNSFTRINGQPSLAVSVINNLEENPFTTAKNVRKELALINQHLPIHYKIAVEYDATAAIQDQLNQLYAQAFFIVLLILVIVSLIFRNVITVVLFLASLIITILLSSLLLFSTQHSIYVLNTNAYLTSVGFMAAILVLAFLNQNQLGTRKTSIYWIYGTLITVISLASISLLESNSQQTTYIDFTLITLCCFVTVIVVASLLVPALKAQFKVLIPLTTQQQQFPTLAHQYYSFIRFQNRFKTVFIVASIVLLGLPTFLPSQLANDSKFAAFYNATIGSKWYNKQLSPVLGGTLRLFKEYVYVKDFYVPVQQTVLHISAILPKHATTQQLDNILQTIESELERYPQIDKYVTSSYNSTQGNISVYFKQPYDKGHFPNSLKTKIELLASQTSGVDWSVYGTGLPFDKRDATEGLSKYQITVKGYHYPTLDQLVLELASRLASKKRVENVDVYQSPDSFLKTDLVAYKMNYDKAYWSFQNVSGSQLYSSLKKYDQQAPVHYHTTIDNQFVGISILPIQPNVDLYTLSNEPLSMGNGRTIMLTSNDYFEKTNITPKVIRENQNYIRLINFDYSGESNFGDKFINQVLDEFNQSAPVGYSATEKHSYFSFQLNQRSYELIGLALLLIIIVSAVMTESLLKPFTLILSIAYTLIGTFLIFYWSSTPFDQGGFLSFFYSIGLTSVPISMVINSYATFSKNMNQDNLFSYVLAIKATMKSILLYTIVIVVCLIPTIVLTQNTIFWQALSVGISGSLLITPLVLLFLTPLILIPKKATH